MKKVYGLIYIINILLGIVLAYSYTFIINRNITTIIMFSGLCLLYILLTFLFFKKKKTDDTMDYIMLNVYLLFMMGLFVYNMVYQSKYEGFSLLYYNVYVYIVHVIYIIYNLFK